MKTIHHPLACLRQLYSVLQISGNDARTFLQSQITQDIRKLTSEHPTYAVVLSPQGKAVAEVYIMAHQSSLLLLTGSREAEALLQRLQRFTLGHQVQCSIAQHLSILSIQGQESAAWLQRIQAVMSFSMPEAYEQGYWCIIPSSHAETVLQNLPTHCSEHIMEQACIIHGTPRFGRDWDATISPMNANLVEMQGVSFDKGCYVGQEIISRMHWRGGVKKKLYHVQLSAMPSHIPPCPIQTSITIGSLQSCAVDEQGDAFGIAHLPIEIVEQQKRLTLNSGEHVRVRSVCQRHW